MPTKHEGEGSNPSGRTHSRLAQWQSTAPTPRGPQDQYLQRLLVPRLGWVRGHAVTVVRPVRSRLGTPRVGGTAATAPGCRPGIPHAGSSPARPTLLPWSRGEDASVRSWRRRFESSWEHPAIVTTHRDDPIGATSHLVRD